MTNLAHEIPFGAQDYLAWEAFQEEKHEFIAGGVFAMTGARRAMSSSTPHSSRKCLRIPPRLRPGQQIAACRTHAPPSLMEYVLVDADARRVECFRRTAENDQVLHEYLAGCGECRFPALGVSVPFEEVFKNLEASPSGEVKPE